MTLWKAEGRKFRVSRIIIISALFILDAIYVACTARELQLAYIDNRDFPGGPLQWLIEDYGDPVNTLSSASVTPILLVQDVALVRLSFARLMFISATDPSHIEVLPTDYSISSYLVQSHTSYFLAAYYVD